MPCRDGRDDWGPTESQMDAQNSAFQRQISEMKKRLDDTTALLCGVMTYMSEQKSGWAEEVLKEVVGLPAWWKEHQEHDRQRLRSEISRTLINLPLDKLREIDKILGGGKS